MRERERKARSSLFHPNQSQSINQSSFLTLIITAALNCLPSNSSSITIPNDTILKKLTRDTFNKGLGSASVPTEKNLRWGKNTVRVNNRLTLFLSFSTWFYSRKTVGRDTLSSRIFTPADLDRKVTHVTMRESPRSRTRLRLQAPPRIAPLHEVHEELSRDAAARDDVTPETGDPSHNHGQADRCPREYGAREAEMVTLPERRRTLSRGLHSARPRILSILFESALPRSTLFPDGKLAAATLRHR